MTAPTLASTLDDCKRWLRDQFDRGAKCPCCDQLVRLYRRPLHHSMAEAMIRMYLAGAEREFVYMPEVLNRKQHDEAKLRYWGLIEEAPIERPDGSTRAGYWRLTPLGVRFVLGEVTVPRYAHTYNAVCLRLDGPQISVRDALGDAFDYGELMKPP